METQNNNVPEIQPQQAAAQTAAPKVIENEHLTRHFDLIPPDKVKNFGVTIVGAGAIGSFAALALAKSGFENITVYDFDDVSIENMSCQGYRFMDIGKKKVDALVEIVEMFTKVKINVVPTRWKPSYNENQLVVVAVDTMKARQEIFEAIAAGCFNTTCIIDPRMGAEVAALYCMNPHTEAESYKKTLYSDAEAVQEKCTAKATNYTANILAGWVVKLIKNIALQQSYARITQINIADNVMESFTKEVKH